MMIEVTLKDTKLNKQIARLWSLNSFDYLEKTT